MLEIAIAIFEIVLGQTGIHDGDGAAAECNVLKREKVVAIAAAGGGGNALKVGWQLSGGLSAPHLPLTFLPIAVVAVVAVVNQRNGDGAYEGIAAAIVAVNPEWTKPITLAAYMFKL
uniref:Uncharacterized protein n=1 Tax=Glossina palpalis gambiensis TaxID=67801 RepID=A0A1B0BUF4_9MUSC